MSQVLYPNDFYFYRCVVMAQGRIMRQFFKVTSPLFVFTVLVHVVGCAIGENAATGTGVGAMTGAGAGAIIGSPSGQAGQGAVVGATSGAVIGGLTGGVVDASEQDEKNKKKRDELLEFQQREFDRQYREVEDLRRQQYEDQEFRRKYGDGQ